jgi:hypothetical protein
MPPDTNGERPPQAPSTDSVADQDDQGSLVSTLGHTDERAADAALTVAWLKVHADLCYAIDPSGQLSAHLRDHADCREALAAGRR